MDKEITKKYLEHQQIINLKSMNPIEWLEEIN